MNERATSLISLLVDGHFHSGEELGKSLGISRAAVWKLVKGIEPMGLEVHAVSGKGYRLAKPLELLDDEAIIGQLDEISRPLLTRIELLQVVDSTNAFLVQNALNGSPGGVACFAEYQERGRGRRGRQWTSPYGSNIYLSLLWRFQEGAGRLGGLSLAVAVAVMRALVECGLRSAGVKWPNDILVNNRKLAGILLEVAGESNGPCYAVIGLGVNFDMPEMAADTIEQPWTDLRSSGVSLGRNVVAGRILHHLLLAIPQYLQSGLDAFREEWRRWDLMTDQSVVILQGEEKRYGVARGIDTRGLLLLENEEGIKRFSSGEVSLRSVVS
jgi:BirA family biotin operon repressor/biotin-[acetyl-CoA-carboxylase] ligase